MGSGTRAGRAWAWLRLLVVVLLEAALVVGLAVAGRFFGTVSFAHFGAWVAHTAPGDAVLPLVRLVLLAVCGWFLLATVVNLAMSVSAREEAGRCAVRWLPSKSIRRLIDAVATVSIGVAAVGSSVGAGAASAAPMHATAAVAMPGRSSSPAVSPRASSVVVTPQREVGEVPDAQEPARPVPSRVPVNTRTVGRHLPHPGVVNHSLPPHPAVPANRSAPSPENGFAGIPAGSKVVIVQPGDCLSVLAQTHLGDWRLDHKITALNYGLPQPTGWSLRDENVIYPGWVLRVPENAVNAIVVGAPATAASNALGAGAVGTAAAAGANGTGVTGNGVAAPTGGPAASTPAATAVPSTAAPATSVPVPVSVPAPVPASGTAAATGTGATTATSAPANNRAATTPAVKTGPGVTGVAAAAREKSGPKGGSLIGIPVEDLAAAGVAAAGFLLLLAKLRRVQASRRRRGERAPRPTGEQALVEMGARATADMSMVEFVDAANRLLTVGLVDSEHVVPVILGIEVYSDERLLVVLLDDEAKFVPQGFEASDDTREWVLRIPEEPAAFQALAATVADVIPALPALAAMGRDEEGVTVLVNLEAVGLVSLNGDDDLAEDVVASLAVELATSPWSQQCQLYVIGMGRPGGLGQAEPVSVYTDVAGCLDALADHAATVAAALAEHEETTLARLRLDAGIGEIGPVIVLCAKTPPPEDLAALVELAADPARGLAAVVVAGGGTGEWSLELADGGLDLPAFDRRISVQRVSRSVLAAMEGNLAVAASAPLPAHTAATAATTDESDWFTAAGGAEPEAADGDGEGSGEDAPAEVTGEAEAAVAADEEGDAVAYDDEVDDPHVAAVQSHLDKEVEEVLRELDGPTDDDDEVVPSSVRPLRPSIEQIVARILTDLLPHLDLHPAVLFDVLGPTVRIIRIAEHVGPPVKGAAPVGVIGLPRTAGLEAAAYVALHEDDPPLYSKVQEITFPEQAAKGAMNLTSFQTTMTAVRTALGKNSVGEPILSYKTKQGRLRLNKGGLTTWRLFELLLIEAEATLDRKQQIRYLVAALSLLGDEGPFSRAANNQADTSGGQQGKKARVRRWVWTDGEGIRPKMETAIVDAAGMAAQLLMAEGDYAGARKAISKGLMVTGLNVELWQLLMDDAAKEGNWNGLQLIRDSAERLYQDLEPNANLFELLDTHYLSLIRGRTGKSRRLAAATGS